MVQWILQIMDSYGYLGMALLILGENLFPPIPSEVILTFGGFMTSYTKMHIPGAVLSATVGSVGGALILYQLGSLLTPERLDTLFTGRVGKILGLRKENLQKAADWFDSKGNYAVFFCRFIPIIRSLVSVPALGSLLWNLLLICAGAAAGSSWQKAVRYFGSYTQAAKIVLGTALLAGILFLIRRRLSSGSSET